MNSALTTQMKSVPIDDRQWEAVISRDRTFDGNFVYAVSSTGIYCRPSCPSRKPERALVSFFPLPEAAENAGFRPCLRCKPKEVRVLAPQVDLVRRVCHYLDSTDSDTAKLSDLARHAGVSMFHLQRTFKSIMGISPREYFSARRFGGFKTQVRNGGSVTTALYDAGFNSSSRLYEKASDELGMTPATYGRGGKGASIRYTIVNSPLGRLLAAVTERGVCAVRMADDDIQLEAELRAEFSLAHIERDDVALSPVVQNILDHLSNKQIHVDLPLDIRCTAFQRQVWERLRQIPYGETFSYGAVAKALGKPGAVRAVGHACASNPVALVIPCHRVVREDHTLGGYRWGLERKKKLLAQEKSNR